MDSVGKGLEMHASIKPLQKALHPLSVSRSGLIRYQPVLAMVAARHTESYARIRTIFIG